jgi:hypothetical protein
MVHHHRATQEHQVVQFYLLDPVHLDHHVGHVKILDRKVQVDHVNLLTKENKIHDFLSIIMSLPLGPVVPADPVRPISPSRPCIKKCIVKKLFGTHNILVNRVHLERHYN